METESLLLIKRTLSYANSSWIGITLLVCLVLSLFIIGIYKRQYLFQLQGFFSAQNRQVAYTLDETNSQGYMLIWSIAIITYGLFFSAYFSYPFYHLNLPPFNFIITVIAITALYFILKFALISLWGSIFQMNELAHQFRSNYYILKATVGIIILPLLFILFYCPQFNHLWIFGIIWICIFLGIFFSLYKSILIFFHSFLSFLYIILYLCTLEILPIFLLGKGIKLLITNV